MAEKKPQAAKDSSDSDDSMEGRPDFSGEESELPDNLLQNSNKFVQGYEEHQPELQKIIDQLRKNTVKFLDEYGKATTMSRTGKITAAAAVAAGAGLAIVLAPVTLGLSLAVGAGVATVGAGVGGKESYEGERKKKAEEKKVQEEVEKALEKFNTTVKMVIKHLQNICNDLEKILKHKDYEQSALIKSEAENLRRHGEALSQLAKLLSVDDLRRMIRHGMRTLNMAENIDPLTATLLAIINLLFIFEDNRTLRDIAKLKEKFTVPEYLLESQMGRFICKMRETIVHLQKTLDETSRSKTEVQRVLIPNLNEYFRLQRGSYSL